MPRSNILGSSTTTVEGSILSSNNNEDGTLRLQGDSTTEIEPNTQNRRSVRWTEEVVDNEHMNKKKSKVCCIFHKQRNFGESSDESSSSDSNDSDSESDREYTRRRLADRKKKKSQDKGGHNHSDDDRACNCNHDHDNEALDTSTTEESRKERLENLKKRGKLERNPSPNAYERQPKYT